MSGLALARELVRKGRECVVLEADRRPGGIVRSERVGGLLLEHGPQRARLTPAFAALVNDVGLAESLIRAPEGLDFLIHRDGKLRRVPLSLAGLLASDVVSWRGKLRAMLEPLAPGPRDDERVAAFFSRKLGREAYEHVVGPLYGGLYGTDPRDMVVGLSLGGLLRDLGIGRSLVLSRLRRRGARAPSICSFQDGMESLPRALARALGERVRLDTPVRAIEPRPGGWSIVLDEETVPAERVVLAVPAPVAARLLRDTAPDASGRIGGLRYNPLAVVHVRADTDLRGIGFQMSLAEPRALRGVTFNHCLFGGEEGRADRTGVYTACERVRRRTLAGSDRGRRSRLRRPAIAEQRRSTPPWPRTSSRCTGYSRRPTMPAWDRRGRPDLRLPPRHGQLGEPPRPRGTLRPELARARGDPLRT